MVSYDLLEWYEYNKYTTIKFNETLTKQSGLIPREIYLYLHGSRLPCQIYSLSLSGVDILIKMSSQDLDWINSGKNCYINYSFLGLSPFYIPTTFLVPYYLVQIDPFAMLKEHWFHLVLSSIDAPPLFLIQNFQILSRFIKNFTKRKEDRITLNNQSCNLLGLNREKCFFRINQKKWTCKTRDISSGGACIMINPQFIPREKRGTLSIEVKNPPHLVDIPVEIRHMKKNCDLTRLSSLNLKFINEDLPEELDKRFQIFTAPRDNYLKSSVRVSSRLL